MCRCTCAVRDFRSPRLAGKQRDGTHKQAGPLRLALREQSALCTELLRAQQIANSPGEHLELLEMSALVPLPYLLCVLVIPTFDDVLVQETVMDIIPHIYHFIIY